MIAFKLAKKTYFGATDRYDARVGILHVGMQDNGEGHWNWWVALAEQGPAAGDHAIVESGGAKSFDEAKRQVRAECRAIAYAITEDS